MKNTLHGALFAVLLLSSTLEVEAQVHYSRITGTVIDRVSRQGVVNANVFIQLPDSDATILGTVTDLDGRFNLEKVPAGRHFLHCSHLSYGEWISPLLEITSARITEITIELAEKVNVNDSIVVLGRKSSSETDNEFGAVSGRSFTPEETQRFAGSIYDPGRMALSLPGVQVAQQDNENTIVVRANSPIGLTWHLEGVEIPNPNHFAEAGSSGGGISALSTYVLGTSDFFSGAFPAEYGNALSGVMDLKFRQGNREDRQFRIQAGLIGLDFASEGPLSRKRKTASYLFNYRYSTLGILSSMGINIVNPLTSNTFQDVSFNFFVPLSKKSFLTFFGLGGYSAENKKAESDPAKWESYNEVYTYDFYTKVGVTGLTYTYLINEKSSLYGVLSVGANDIRENDDTVGYDFAKTRIRNEHYMNGRITTLWEYNRRLGASTNLKAGFRASQLFYNVFRNDYDKALSGLRIQMDGAGNTTLLQPYLEAKSPVGKGKKSTLLYGLNGLYFDYNKQFLIEPRAALQFKLPKGGITVAYGLHSQILPFQTYEAVTTDSLTGSNRRKPNQHLTMWRSHHLVLSLTHQFPNTIRLKVEPYFQYLFNVPVSGSSWNTYSLINQDRNFFADSLISKGTGYNAGAEVTLEKSFTNRLFFLLSVAAYDSRFATNNGGPNVYYNTRYNANFNSALTFGKEWALSNNRRLELGGRILWSGGMRYTPFDSPRSIESGRTVYVYSATYTQQNINYFRIDTRIALRKNSEKFSWRLSLDIQNLTGYQNPQRPYFDRWTGNVAYNYNTSITPVISYMIDF